ncbi:uroporphyrinogen-III C-methyltransferase [Oceanobacillus neutriphilus]|uniref:uroporphyrinogen-III C-methyltransferase n=1 Tax=Oceanobacillus neutriphilus TaxID=531815 RepID=A0ABQ2NZA1_9BACI|nr:uroporphyrinogen-III C-methyltransferase [Oceanobacillus neutriphilus]GGP14197.1 bifunctional uroporphyrinogen III methyltransferase/uroporphyrinogen III methyltransferase [Oceanobacillus neutriphilus]
METSKGFVSFVGAGPGDTGLVTEKGIQCLKKADIILYDRLANPRLLRNAKDSCEFIYCGKLPERHTMRQEKINKLLVQYASEGCYVVRLKGGDPSVFGRVGEEAEELAAYHIAFEIVPGITSSIAAAAYAGIPVTHRDYSTSLTFRTGHTCESNAALHGDGQLLGDTIAYYMGMKKMLVNCRELIKQGKPADTKVAIIQWGTLGKQKVAEGTLETIQSVIEEGHIESPAMMIVGDVVELRKKLIWFDKKKFSGRRILIAKASGNTFALEDYFTELGAEAYSFPIWKQKVHTFSEEELKAIMKSDRLVFTNVYSVDILFDQFCQAHYDIRNLPRSIVYQTKKTRKALAARGILAVSSQDNDISSITIGSKTDTSHTKETFPTHEWLVDKRFDEINKRMLTEDDWETVIFPNKAAVTSFKEELKKLEMYHLLDIQFAYIGESVKKYAMEQGFSVIDEAVQSELKRMNWRD